jgi:hypothetical protein
MWTSRGIAASGITFNSVAFELVNRTAWIANDVFLLCECRLIKIEANILPAMV